MYIPTKTDACVARNRIAQSKDLVVMTHSLTPY